MQRTDDGPVDLAHPMGQIHLHVRAEIAAFAREEGLRRIPKTGQVERTRQRLGPRGGVATDQIAKDRFRKVVL